MKILPLVGATALAAISANARAADVSLHWLDGASPPAPTGVSWGVPFPRGTVQKNQTFSLTAADGKALPLQSWTLAYWPDGSIKWTGFATTASPGETGNLKLSTVAPGENNPANGAVAAMATDNPNYIQVNTGPLQCVISKSGANIIDWLAVNGYTVAQNGQLSCILQDGPDNNPEDPPHGREKYVSAVKKVTLEQNGPVRTVVKIEGLHQGAQSGREWLPFTVRLYFYSGETSVRLVHTIVFDGNQEKDFLRGIAVQFSVPLRDQPQNRYVRFSGEGDGLWAEPLQPGGGDAQQEAGQPFAGRGGFEQNAVWDDFKLVQPNPDGFTIVKRTNPQSTWLFSAAGRRSSGLAFVGGVNGGLAISVKNFWQSYPAGLEVQKASSPLAQLTAWLWSPDGPQMDMRHYDIIAHGLGPSYEDVQPGMSTAFGIARTSELTLYPTGAIPSKLATVAMAKTGEQLPMIACTPEYIHSTGVFGVWSLPDRSTPLKQAVEDRLDSVLAYYEKQVDERDWYGFWQFGDFMHSYSTPRHTWNYDWGGHAWDNTELGAPLWLWYSYLRTGRADLFRLAEAHSRNTSETDVYHLGPMSGLGSRHNVIKWGDGAKEARISQSAHWRPFYYLTTDERTGDLMHEMATSADLAVAKYDPMREAEPQVPGEPVFPVRIRIGPDWFALAGNWMTEWERTGDTKWRDRILAGVDSILAMPYWIRSGQFNGLNPDRPDGSVGPLKGGGSMTVGLDLATGKLTAIPDPIAHQAIPVNYNLATIQGGAEVMFELVPLLDRPDWEKAWLQYCRLSGDVPLPPPQQGADIPATAAMLTRDRITGAEGADAQYVESAQGGPRLAAYAYAKTKNPAFAKRAIASFGGRGSGAVNSRLIAGPDSLKPMDEAFGISTNTAAQSSLTAIEILELCADILPNDVPPAPPGGRGGRGGQNAQAGGQNADAAAPAAP